MACLDQFSEFEHLERILLDAVSDEPIIYDESSVELPEGTTAMEEKYTKYQKEPYKPEPHYERSD